MQLRANAELVYSFSDQTQLIALLQAAQSADQQILREELSLSPAASVVTELGIGGERWTRAVVSGEVTIRYEADIDNGSRSLLPNHGRRHLWSELPQEVLTFLLPSRFCPSDEFQRFAVREFGNAGDGVAQVMAVLEWIHRHVDYIAGVSDAASTAAHTFTVRAGVCRDFTHLGITLCRALSIPARAISAYALDLNPSDFHAVMEVYLEGQWWTVDPTRLAPVEGMIRIAHGRDAADIAFLTTDRACQLVKQSVNVSRL